MSTLLVEVCEIVAIEPHPDPETTRLEVAMVKGWKVCVKKGEFLAGQKVVYFPPDSILPPMLAHGPDDDPPGRLGVIRYLASLPKDEEGRRPAGGRVKAARLRGQQSFGVIMAIDASQRDDPDWPVGLDVKEHYGVAKWEPPPPSSDGDAAPPHPHFHRYTDIEHFANYPHVIEPGEEVVITEKLHGKNCRVGLVLDAEKLGAQQINPSDWIWVAGSHDIRRRQFSLRTKRFKVRDLVEKMILPSPAGENDATVPGLSVEVGMQIDMRDGKFWRVDEVRRVLDRQDGVSASGDARLSCTEVTKQGDNVQIRSEFWEPLTEPVKNLLEHLRDERPWGEAKFGVVLFGELHGRGVQKGMEYGMKERGFRVFDIAINGRYLGFNEKSRLLADHNIEMVPILYRGPFRKEVVDQFTDGPTTLAAAADLGKFKGREGVVITPVVERGDDPVMRLTGTRGRVILKSISADYLARSDIADGH